MQLLKLRFKYIKNYYHNIFVDRSRDNREGKDDAKKRSLEMEGIEILPEEAAVVNLPLALLSFQRTYLSPSIYIIAAINIIAHLPPAILFLLRWTLYFERNAIVLRRERDDKATVSQFQTSRWLFNKCVTTKQINSCN